MLLISSLSALAVLVVARIVFPLPERLEEGGPRTATAAGFTRAYWLYTAAGALFAAGLMSFELISFHLATTGAVTQYRIPLFLAIASAMGVLATLLLGRLYDRAGIAAIVLGVIASSLFSPLVFLGGPWIAVAGLMLWGVGYATQDTLLKALIASVLPEGKRSLAFGLFYLGYGGGWLVGSVVTGLLYGRSLAALIAFAITVQLASLPLFVAGARASAPGKRLPAN